VSSPYVRQHTQKEPQKPSAYNMCSNFTVRTATHTGATEAECVSSVTSPYARQHTQKKPQKLSAYNMCSYFTVRTATHIRSHRSRVHIICFLLHHMHGNTHKRSHRSRVHTICVLTSLCVRQHTHRSHRSRVRFQRDFTSGQTQNLLNKCGARTGWVPWFIPCISGSIQPRW